MALNENVKAFQRFQTHLEIEEKSPMLDPSNVAFVTKGENPNGNKSYPSKPVDKRTVPSLKFCM